MFPWVQFLTYLAVSSLSPGPNTISALSTAGRLGLRHALPFCLGVGGGVFAATLLCAAVCQALSALLDRLRTPLLILAAGYLLVMAWRTWRSGSLTEQDHPLSGFRTGLFFQFFNPNLYVYCLLALEVYVLPHFAGQPLALVGFSLLIAAVGCGGTVAWAAFGSLFRQLFSRYAKQTNAVMALLLAWCALALFF
ncbi:MAG: LysE family transporter [Oscillibacter sp.]